MLPRTTTKTALDLLAPGVTSAANSDHHHGSLTPDPGVCGQFSLREARSWVGRRVSLKHRYRNFPPGTECAVMCVVDFGDELLLWITTACRRAEEIDQFERKQFYRHFAARMADRSESDRKPVVAV